MVKMPPINSVNPMLNSNIADKLFTSPLVHCMMPGGGKILVGYFLYAKKWRFL